jgi:hypothetical protein
VKRDTPKFAMIQRRASIHFGGTHFSASSSTPVEDCGNYGAPLQDTSGSSRPRGFKDEEAKKSNVNAKLEYGDATLVVDKFKSKKYESRIERTGLNNHSSAAQPRSRRRRASIQRRASIHFGRTHFSASSSTPFEDCGNYGDNTRALQNGSHGLQPHSNGLDKECIPKNGYGGDVAPDDRSNYEYGDMFPVVDEMISMPSRCLSPRRGGGGTRRASIQFGTTSCSSEDRIGDHWRAHDGVGADRSVDTMMHKPLRYLSPVPPVKRKKSFQHKEAKRNSSPGSDGGEHSTPYNYGIASSSKMAQYDYGNAPRDHRVANNSQRWSSSTTAPLKSSLETNGRGRQRRASIHNGATFSSSSDRQKNSYVDGNTSSETFGYVEPNCNAAPEDRAKYGYGDDPIRILGLVQSSANR